MMIDYEGLERLARLRDAGALTEEEYNTQKQRILAGGESLRTRLTNPILLVAAFVVAISVLALAAFSGSFADRDVQETNRGNETEAVTQAPLTPANSVHGEFGAQPAPRLPQDDPPAVEPSVDLAEVKAGEARLVRGIPRRVGDCARTTIQSVGTRLEEEGGQPVPGSGSAVTLANGVYGVEYDQVTSVDRSQKGDKVRTCLVEIPKGCPAGDDRGRVYTTTNLRTGGSWTLPDASHMCGGA